MTGPTCLTATVFEIPGVGSVRSHLCDRQISYVFLSLGGFGWTHGAVKNILKLPGEATWILGGRSNKIEKFYKFSQKSETSGH